MFRPGKFGGLMNALLLNLEASRQSKLDHYASGLMIALGILTLAWGVITVMFLVTRQTSWLVPNATTPTLWAHHRPTDRPAQRFSRQRL